MSNENVSSAEAFSDDREAAAGFIGDLIKDRDGQLPLSDGNSKALSGDNQSGRNIKNKEKLSSSSDVGTNEQTTTKMRQELRFSSKDLTTAKNLQEPMIKVNKITSMKTSQNESDMIIVKSQDTQNFNHDTEGQETQSPSFRDPYASNVHSLVGSSKYKHVRGR